MAAGVKQGGHSVPRSGVLRRNSNLTPNTKRHYITLDLTPHYRLKLLYKNIPGMVICQIPLVNPCKLSHRCENKPHWPEVIYADGECFLFFAP
jgi:hypothetical protein